MTTSTLAFGKASALGTLRRLERHHARHQSNTATAAAKAATAAATAAPATAPAPATPPTTGTAHGSGSVARTPDLAATQRELFMNILNANATKRDAKPYLARFMPAKATTTTATAVPPPPTLSAAQRERRTRSQDEQDRLDRMGVNLGGLYSSARAIAETPVFTQHDIPSDHLQAPLAVPEEIHVALVCLRAPETLDDATLDGVALTLSQLVKLDMRVVLVVDSGTESPKPALSKPAEVDLAAARKAFTEQSERLSRAVSRHSPEGARVVAECMEASGATADSDPFSPRSVSVGMPSLLLKPLQRSVIPIIPALAYTPSGQLVHVPVSEVMTALSEEMSILQTGSDPREAAIRTSLDRIILLDAIGGIPSKARANGAHVFINLEQEYESIDGELSEYGHAIENSERDRSVRAIYEQHRQNLTTLHDCLSKLPPASSALVITPQEAASSSQSTADDNTTIGAGTRRQKNPVIHNLLTNKPMISSSLPVARLPANNNVVNNLNGSVQPSVPTPGSTLIKRGMPLTIIPPASRTWGWQHPASGMTSLALDADPRVDFPRLVHLIDNSFRRQLDVQHYLARIRGSVAGLIVAGDYEGGAILTWEQPPAVAGATSDPARLVPYLDKFAVLQSSQGSSGVADMVFQAMVRTCFPTGVCWRSRHDNPVNKWYFERCDGSWRIPGTQWTMFWTGQGVVEDERRFWDYVGVCKGVVPSWADGKRPD